jgi:hypothetical protein
VRDVHTYDYAVVRVVPRVERAEFLNAGIIVSCDVERILQAKIELDEAALLALCPNVDLDLVKQSLASIPKICAGGEAAGAIGKMTPRERFHWLVAPRSTIVQTSPVHTGQCARESAAKTEADAMMQAMEHLMDTMVRRRSVGAE